MSPFFQLRLALESCVSPECIHLIGRKVDDAIAHDRICRVIKGHLFLNDPLHETYVSVVVFLSVTTCLFRHLVCHVYSNDNSVFPGDAGGGQENVNPGTLTQVKCRISPPLGGQTLWGCRTLHLGQTQTVLPPIPVNHS